MRKKDVRVCERMRERGGRTNIVQRENFENKVRERVGGRGGREKGRV